MYRRVDIQLSWMLVVFYLATYEEVGNKIKKVGESSRGKNMVVNNDIEKRDVVDSESV